MLIAEQISYQLSLGKQRKQLVASTSFKVDTGDFVALIGPNGAGKTSLLQLLTGDIKPDTGHILLDEHVLSNYSILQLAQKRAVLPQIVHIPFAVNVRAILMMGVMPYPVSLKTSAVQNLLDEVIEILCLEHLMNRIYQSLSGGEQHRVQIGRVLMQVLYQHNTTTRYLFLDEPFNHLDLYHQQRLLKYFRALKKLSITTVCVMHDINQALKVADRIILMDQGVMIGIYTPTSLIVSNALERVFKVPFIQLSHPDYQYAHLVSVSP